MLRTSSIFQMLNVVLIEKTGQLRGTAVKMCEEADLYKKCGFKSPHGFTSCGLWEHGDGSGSMCLYGKLSGAASSANLFAIPQSDATMFGMGIIVGKNAEGKFVNISMQQWEALFGNSASSNVDVDAVAVDTAPPISAHSHSLPSPSPSEPMPVIADDAEPLEDNEDEDEDTDEDKEDSDEELGYEEYLVPPA